MAGEAVQRRGNGFKDIAGQRFGRLVAVRYVGLKKVGTQGQRKSIWLCRCDCGSETEAHAQNLRKGTTQSCGCLLREVRSSSHKKHGMRGAPEYDSWCRMIQRCTNKNGNRWENYGGRGITVCPEWRNDFAAFFAHVGSKPSPKHSLDRINNDGNYEPGNVRWATFSEQMFNRRKWKKKKLVTHCRRGHEYTEANTSWWKSRGDLQRVCKICARNGARGRMRLHRMKKKATSI